MKPKSINKIEVLKFETNFFFFGIIKLEEIRSFVVYKQDNILCTSACLSLIGVNATSPQMSINVFH